METKLIGKYNKQTHEYTLKGDFRNVTVIQDFFEKMSKFPCVESIVFENTVIKDTGAGHVAEGIEKIKNLKRVVFLNNLIGPDGGRRLAQTILNHEQLKHFTFKCNRVGDGCCSVFGRAIKEKKLKSLVLHGANLTAEGFQILSSNIKSSTPLELFDVSFNNLTDLAATEFVSMTRQNKPIETVNFADVGISDASLRLIIEALQVNSSFKNVDLSFNEMSEKTATYLVKSLPKIKKQMSFSAQQVQLVQQMDESLK